MEAGLINTTNTIWIQNLAIQIDSPKPAKYRAAVANSLPFLVSLGDNLSIRLPSFSSPLPLIDISLMERPGGSLWHLHPWGRLREYWSKFRGCDFAAGYASWPLLEQPLCTWRWKQWTQSSLHWGVLIEWGFWGQVHSGEGMLPRQWIVPWHLVF